MQKVDGRFGFTLIVLVLMAIVSLRTIGFSQTRPSTIPAAAPNDPRLVLDMPPQEAYRAALFYWAAGEQGLAEVLLAELTNRHPQDLRIAFFNAACTRSRFDIGGALPLFKRVALMAPGTPEAQCANLMVKLDSENGNPAPFAALEKLAKENRDDPIIIWMAGVQCRSLNKNEVGITHYRRLLAMIEPAPGPVLLHQTFANLLDETKQFDEALVHRRIAVKMEPAGWSIEGLGNTLSSLKRYAEAENAFREALKHSPNNPRYIWDISRVQYDAGDYEKSMASARRALEIAPSLGDAWITLGLGLEHTGEWQNALDAFAKAREIDAKSPYGYRNAIRVLQSLGRDDEAVQINAAWVKNGGQSMIRPASTPRAPSPN